MIEKPSGGIIDPQSLVEFVDDFHILNGTYGWTPTVAGTSAAVNQGTGYSARTFGGNTLTTGSTTTGSADLTLGVPSGWWGLTAGDRLGVDVRAQLITLSTVAQEYIVRIGVWDKANNGIFFEYDRLNSVNWRLRCGDGTLSTTTSSTAVAIAMRRYGFRATSTGVDFYVNGVNIGTVSANIPGNAATMGTPIIQIVSSAGTTQKQLYVDYYAMRYVLTAGR